ncbi:hypothetical protein IMSHALPRED_003142 [Imshaugia aleurites]|uniref:Amino acid transporter n=1 Tax=Imshaugia aleurites TaxID=172621 RepID=A0A8H3J716_9LECA|nr:hypothetical protein IMSHALPRED_003142 [Imshaugia aleurites]
MSQGQELQNLDSNHSYAGPYSAISGSRHRIRDEQTLARLGKKQVLKRRFGFLSLIGFSCTILVTWESVLALFQEAFQNGGPAGLLYGFLISWFSSLSVYMVIAEMASIAPTAGGQYFWVSMLAPVKYRRFASYITGWLTSIAWIAVLATGSVFVGTIWQGLIILDNDSYQPQKWQGTLLCWAVLAVAVFINTVVSGLLPMIEGIILVLHVLGFVAVIVPLVYLSPHGSAASVFKTVLNEGGWPTQGMSYCVGFIGNVATFVGADAAVHMSEEIENAALNVPRAILTTMILNGATGFAMVLAVLFCLGDVNSVLMSPTGFPFIQVFYNGVKSKAGATVMASIVVALAWCAVIGFLATASRMIWSFARDRGLPFHRLISKVEPRASIPIIAIALVTVIPALLALIYIGSSTVFEDVVSLSTSGLYASYFIPCSLLLWRRTTGQVQPHSAYARNDSETIPEMFHGFAASDSTGEVAEPQLAWGPWHLPGIFGVINNIYACIYILFVLFWSFWPPLTPVTAQNMNYSVLMTFAVIAFSIVYYFIWGRKQYKGPLVERDVGASVVVKNTKRDSVGVIGKAL